MPRKINSLITDITSVEENGNRLLKCTKYNGDIEDVSVQSHFDFLLSRDYDDVDADGKVISIGEYAYLGETRGINRLTGVYELIKPSGSYVKYPKYNINNTYVMNDYYMKDDILFRTYCKVGTTEANSVEVETSSQDVLVKNIEYNYSSDDIEHIKHDFEFYTSSELGGYISVVGTGASTGKFENGHAAMGGHYLYYVKIEEIGEDPNTHDSKFTYSRIDILTGETELEVAVYYNTEANKYEFQRVKAFYANHFIGYQATGVFQRRVHVAGGDDYTEYKVQKVIPDAPAFKYNVYVPDYSSFENSYDHYVTFKVEPFVCDVGDHYILTKTMPIPYFMRQTNSNVIARVLFQEGEFVYFIIVNTDKMKNEINQLSYACIMRYNLEDDTYSHSYNTPFFDKVVGICMDYNIGAITTGFSFKYDAKLGYDNDFIYIHRTYNTFKIKKEVLIHSEFTFETKINDFQLPDNKYYNLNEEDSCYLSSNHTNTGFEYEVSVKYINFEYDHYIISNTDSSWSVVDSATANTSYFNTTSVEDTYYYKVVFYDGNNDVINIDSIYTQISINVTNNVVSYVKGKGKLNSNSIYALGYVVDYDSNNPISDEVDKIKVIHSCRDTRELYNPIDHIDFTSVYPDGSVVNETMTKAQLIASDYIYEVAIPFTTDSAHQTTNLVTIDSILTDVYGNTINSNQFYVYEQVLLKTIKLVVGFDSQYLSEFKVTLDDASEIDATSTTGDGNRTYLIGYPVDKKITRLSWKANNITGKFETVSLLEVDGVTIYSQLLNDYLHDDNDSVPAEILFNGSGSTPAPIILFDMASHPILYGYRVMLPHGSASLLTFEKGILFDDSIVTTSTFTLVVEDTTNGGTENYSVDIATNSVEVTTNFPVDALLLLVATITLDNGNSHVLRFNGVVS